MPLRFIDLQNRTDGFCQLWVNALHTVGDVFMHGRFWNTKFFRRFSHCCIGVYHKFRNLNRPFLNIRFQAKHSSDYRLVMYMQAVGKIWKAAIRGDSRFLYELGNLE